MNTAEIFLSAFRRKNSEAAQTQAAEAVALRSNMQGLLEHPGWTILVTQLTRARESLYRRMEEGTATPEDRAFAKLCRQLCEGPQGILEAATTILRDAATPR